MGNRNQSFTWVNDIGYDYDGNKTQPMHVVVCKETWKEVDKKSNEIVPKKYKTCLDFQQTTEQAEYT